MGSKKVSKERVPIASKQEKGRMPKRKGSTQGKVPSKQNQYVHREDAYTEVSTHRKGYKSQSNPYTNTGNHKWAQ